MIKNNYRCYSKRFVSFIWDHKEKRCEWLTPALSFISKIFYITFASANNLNDDVDDVDHNIQIGD